MKFESGELRLDYETHGEGLPIVFLHGLAIDRRLLREVCEPAFAGEGADTRYKRIYVDLPGHGDSPAAPLYASADGLAEALRLFVHELVGDKELAIVGYSYGGYLAPLLAQHFSSVRGLFLACPVAEPDFGKRRVAHRRVALREPGLRFSEDPREQAAFDEIAVLQTQTVLSAFQRLVHPANVAASQTFLSQVRDRYVTQRPLVSLLQSFAAPTTIVAGHDDHWVGYEDMLPWCRAIQRAALHVLHDAGHLLPLEQPQRLRALLSDWTASL